MSYKPVDLQTSLPRTVELSPMQQQQQQRTANEQAALGQQSIKQAEHQARSNTKAEGAGKKTISDREPRDRGRESSADKRGGAEEQDPGSGQAPHPYKGKHLDISL